MKDQKRQTKQIIVDCAVSLFAAKGYTETTIRDITSAVGINPASLYFHFPSKESLLMFILNDFTEYARTMFNNPDMPSILKKNPTADGILNCLLLDFLLMEDEYYSKVLHVIFQEQHRNDVFRDFVIKTIKDIEGYIEKVFDELKKLNIIRHDANADYWKKTTSSLIYTFSNRILLGIGQDSPDFSGMNTMALLRYNFDSILQQYGLGAESKAQ